MCERDQDQYKEAERKYEWGICEGSEKGKSHVNAFPKSDYGKLKTTSILQIVHSDIMGPMEIVSQGGAKYVIIYIDDYSRCVIAYFMKHKSDAHDRFMEYKAMAENQFEIE